MHHTTIYADPSVTINGCSSGIAIDLTGSLTIASSILRFSSTITITSSSFVETLFLTSRFPSLFSPSIKQSSGRATEIDLSNQYSPIQGDASSILVGNATFFGSPANSQVGVSPSALGLQMDCSTTGINQPYCILDGCSDAVNHGINTFVVRCSSSHSFCSSF